jgi:hypothetical protein
MILGNLTQKIVVGNNIILMKPNKYQAIDQIIQHVMLNNNKCNILKKKKYEYIYIF